jgi:hypothetical protein
LCRRKAQLKSGSVRQYCYDDDEEEEEEEEEEERFTARKVNVH